MRVAEAPGQLILVLGGARSGKSAYAEELAGRLAGGRPVVYLATATASDDEMRERIARHRAARPQAWATIEAPTDPAGALRGAAEAWSGAGTVLLDCITLLVSNVLLQGECGEFDEATFEAESAERRVMATIEALLAIHREGTASLVLVSNEVGMGLVPPYPLGRVYRDVLGRVNAWLAREADTVLLMVAGLPIELKALASAWEAQASERLAPSPPTR